MYVKAACSKVFFKSYRMPQLANSICAARIASALLQVEVAVRFLFSEVDGSVGTERVLFLPEVNGGGKLAGRPGGPILMIVSKFKNVGSSVENISSSYKFNELFITVLFYNGNFIKCLPLDIIRN